MRRAVYVEELTTISYADCVRAEGGKVRLRRRGSTTVEIVDRNGVHRRQVDLTERAAWRGNTRSYLVCDCGAVVLKRLWDEQQSNLRCHRCWPEVRYRKQERRRLRSPTTGRRPVCTEIHDV